MITGGYNIVDFEGLEFKSETAVVLSDEFISKLTDISKPVLIGNFYLVDDATKFYVHPCFALINELSSNDNYIIVVGVITIQVTISTKVAYFNVSF